MNSKNGEICNYSANPECGNYN